MHSHHANLIWADSLASAELPVEYKVPSLDVMHVVVDRFGIDDARTLSALSLQKPLEASIRVFVIVTRDIAQEAQNALLKLFEEPPVHAVFYLVLSKTAYLVPTLLSRLQIQEQPRVSKEMHDESFKEFMSSSYGERLSSIAEKTKSKDTVWIEEVLRGTEVYVGGNPIVQEKLLKDVIFVREHAGAKGASLKMLLEEIALALPLK